MADSVECGDVRLFYGMRAAWSFGQDDGHALGAEAGANASVEAEIRPVKNKSLP
jgi:hypothetical protein